MGNMKTGMTLTHFDDRGDARMVDVSEKQPTRRVAAAIGSVSMKPATLRLVIDRKAAKGDVLGVARLAGIMAAKKTPELIPLCHHIPIHSVDLDLEPDETACLVSVKATVSTNFITGVEMDALTAVSVACLTVYDMLKSADKDMVIGGITLLEKTGGKSGHYLRNEAEKTS